MIETQIIKQGKKPVAVILDYNEYRKLKEIQEEYEDYHEAVNAEQSTKKLHSNDEVKKKLGLK